MSVEKTEPKVVAEVNINKGVEKPDYSLRNTLIASIVITILVSATFGFGAGYLALKQFGGLGNTKNLAQNTIVLQDSAITETVKKVDPSVVSISVKSTAYSFWGTPKTATSSGSGFIVSTDGLIMTNKHVASNKDATYTVTTTDGKKYPATVKVLDPKFDLAILKIEAKGLKTVNFGDSDTLKVGQTAIAIGNPLGQYRNAATVGVISGLGRSIEAGDGSGGSAEVLDNLLQTDAAINPGNSGGPLVDASGAVIGIVTAVDSSAQGIGFAIPINLAKSALNSYLKNGEITRAYLGVRYTTVTQEYATQNKLPVNHGAIIAEDGILENSPAAKAGLKPSDILVKIGNDELTEAQTLSTLIAKYEPGAKVNVTYVRDGKEKTTTVTLEKGQ
jgi:serine protease Do